MDTFIAEEICEPKEEVKLSDSSVSTSISEVKRGVFWVVNNRLIAYPFREGSFLEGVAKSGNTYNHKKLWNLLKISNKPFDHYPRGRVDATSSGKARIYLSPHINQEKWLSEIKTAFNIKVEQCRVIEDHSAHYRCHLDRT